MFWQKSQHLKSPLTAAKSMFLQANSAELTFFVNGQTVYLVPMFNSSHSRIMMLHNLSRFICTEELVFALR